MGFSMSKAFIIYLVALAVVCLVAPRVNAETDDPKKACYITKQNEMKCLTVSDEDLEHTKSCAFIKNYEKRNSCAKENLDPFDDVKRFVYWV